jgi:hypothetical protein
MRRTTDRLVLAMLLVGLTVAFPTERALAKTDITVDGSTVTLSVAIDLIGAVDSAGRAVRIEDDAGVPSAFSDYWGEAATLWNDAFAKHSYNGCINFKLDLQFFPLPYNGTRTPGHHAVLIDPNPDVRPGVFVPGGTDGTKDFTDAFTMDLQGVWGVEDTATVSHEVGHLLGLGDDYIDVKDANGKVTTSAPLPGRENTQMARSHSKNVDQALIDRIGDEVEKSGKKLPSCWTGTMNSSSNYTVTAPDGGLICSGVWSTSFKFTVQADNTVSGTATSTIQGTPVCTHPEFLPTPVATMVSNITGTATATQLQLQLNQVSFAPADGIDTTGMSASLYGFSSVPSTITIPISSKGHAEGSQQLQAISSVNSYTSDNAIALDCQTC